MQKRMKIGVKARQATVEIALRSRGFGIMLLAIPFLITWPGNTECRGQGPGPRYGHDMAYDEQRGLVILFGGFHDNGQPLGDTWSWDGRAWQLAATDGPRPRKWPALSYDAKRGHMLLFGGRTGVGQTGSSLSDTWLWNGADWREIKVNGPPPRDHHRMVYDRSRDRIVLFGGWNGDSLLDDTWEWDGEEWTRVAQRGPGARAPFGLAYHERNERVILFGGKTLDTYFDDTWAWDGEEWKRIDVLGPSKRAFHAMTYDSDRARLLLFSGREGDTMFNDTWAWDGQDWERISTEGPLKRGVHALVYDRKNHRALFHGSGERRNGQWKLDPETWVWPGDAWRLAAD